MPGEVEERLKKKINNKRKKKKERKRERDTQRACGKPEFKVYGPGQYRRAYVKKNVRHVKGNTERQVICQVCVQCVYADVFAE